jgi:hypothetical protein
MIPPLLRVRTRFYTMAGSEVVLGKHARGACTALGSVPTA